MTLERIAELREKLKRAIHFKQGSFWMCHNDVSEMLDAIEERDKEIKRLRGLVRKSFDEGFRACCLASPFDWSWDDSDVKKELDA